MDVIEDSTGKKGTCHRFHKATYTCITFPVFTFQRQYFPLWPCFGSTINKAQGQTLQLVGLDLRTQVFSHGAWHVQACSMLLYQICKMCLFSRGVFLCNIVWVLYVDITDDIVWVLYVDIIDDIVWVLYVDYHR